MPYEYLVVHFEENSWGDNIHDQESFCNEDDAFRDARERKRDNPTDRIVVYKAHKEAVMAEITMSEYQG